MLDDEPGFDDGQVDIYFHSPFSPEFMGKTTKDIEDYYTEMFTSHIMGRLIEKSGDSVDTDIFRLKTKYIVINHIIGHATHETDYQSNAGKHIVEIANHFLPQIADRIHKQGAKSVINQYSAGFLESRVRTLMDEMFAEGVTTADRLGAAQAINKALGINEEQAATEKYIDDKNAFYSKLTVRFKNYNHLDSNELEALLELQIDAYSDGFLKPRVSRLMDAMFADVVTSADRLGAAEAINKALGINEAQAATEKYIDDQDAFCTNLITKIQKSDIFKPNKLADLVKLAIEKSPNLPKNTPLRSYKVYSTQIGGIVHAASITQDKAM